MTYTPDDLLAAAAREADIYGQTRIPAMLRQGAAWGEEVERLQGALLMAAASLAAAISLLERGGKKAAPSDKMFAQMLADYGNALDHARTALQEKPHG